MIRIFISVNTGLEQISDTYSVYTIACDKHPGTGFYHAAKGSYCMGL